MKIDSKLVDRIAGLARLSLSDYERESLLADLNNILSYVEKLNRLDISDVEPTSHVLDLANVTREDEPRPSMPVDEALSNAPDRSGNFYRVPKIIE
ncbi:MAG: Asp-tRNA(Asn)/Glu-tRNA(Gln) amidotransferase subunit GatC [Nitrospirota bacterium]|jgi:aspartyl-tRNA(Asn)/glutamyl-tRNA(Gln) amidotransferase subunit C